MGAWNEGFSIVVSLCTILGTVCTAVWVVATIKATTENLTAAIQRLATVVDRLDEKSDGHAERIARLEAGRREVLKS